MNHLAQSSIGRVVLHTLCLVRHPKNFGWHLRGIVREFVPSTAIAVIAVTYQRLPLTTGQTGVR